jgi:hypothetical protein
LSYVELSLFEAVELSLVELGLVELGSRVEFVRGSRVGRDMLRLIEAVEFEFGRVELSLIEAVELEESCLRLIEVVELEESS